MASKAKTVETVYENRAMGQQVDLFNPNTAWRDAIESADKVAGFDLAKDALLDALAPTDSRPGVPFLITRLTFREGIRKPDGSPGYVVACEAMIAPEDELKRRRINPFDLPFQPGDQIVFNDGSTGIYRQIMAYLVAREILTIEDHKRGENGGFGESKYDVSPVAENVTLHAGDLQYRPDGNWSWHVNVRLFCPRGLRISTYESDYNPMGGKTRYLG